MRLFRKKTSSEEAAPPEAAAPEALEEASPSQADGQADKPKPRRRRGTRGGRGRGGKKKVEAAEGGAKTESKAAAKAEPKPRQPRQRNRRTGRTTKPRRRRTQTPKRSALPKVKKEIFVSVEVTEQRVAVLEDDVAVEVYLGRPSHRSVAGNVYKGVVDNVLPGMEASFVEIGLEKNGFLYVDEIVVPELEGQAAPWAPHPGADRARAGGARPGGQGPDGHEGRPADDRDLASRADSSSSSRTGTASASRAAWRTRSASGSR